jgi:hypothetical protein
MGRVVIGMDPHKRSATIELLDEAEQPLMAGRFGTDNEGYRLLVAAGRRFPQRLWAVEGCEGVPSVTCTAPHPRATGGYMTALDRRRHRSRSGSVGGRP